MSTMDVDVVDQYLQEPSVSSNSGSKSSRKSMNLPVDDAHPFELESYISSYTGRTAVDRLINIIQLCPILATPALQLAVKYASKLRDPVLFQTIITTYNQLPSISEQAPMDLSWVEEITAQNQIERTKLEVELKTYTNNMIKESIRMAHRDLGDFYRAIGDHSAALKHFTKSREFCTTSQHVIDMCLSVLELLIEQKNYSHINTYVFKADAALDAALPSNAGNTATSGVTSGSSSKKSAEREKIQTQLDFATALSHLGQTNYEKAAMGFLRLGPVRGLQDWVGKLVAPADIAVYGTLCALASMSRSAIKSQVLENDTFGVYLEHEPYVRELVDAYLSSKFKIVLELLERYSTRHYIDIHLSSHVHDLTYLIRNRALVLYFQPFASIKLDRMSQAFGLPVEELERNVVSLIQSGDIHGRVDSQNKVLKARETDHRSELFTRAIKAGKDMQSANRKLLLRMHLQQADLVVKAPKGHQHSSLVHPSELLG